VVQTLFYFSFFLNEKKSGGQEVFESNERMSLRRISTGEVLWDTRLTKRLEKIAHFFIKEKK
jgi:hypothetical protein